MMESVFRGWSPPEKLRGFTFDVSIVVLTTRETPQPPWQQTRPPNYEQLTAATLLHLEFLTQVMDNVKIQAAGPEPSGL